MQRFAEAFVETGEEAWERVRLGFLGARLGQAGCVGAGQRRSSLMGGGRGLFAGDLMVG